MEGCLNDTDIYTLCQTLALAQRTGELYLEDERGQTWLLFLNHGHLAYIADRHSQSLERLQDLLYGQGIPLPATEDLIESASGASWVEYECLWWLVPHCPLAQIQMLWRSLLRESLFDIVSLNRGWFKFCSASPLTPQWHSLPLTSLINDSLGQLREWKKLHPYLRSLDQPLEMTNVKPSLPEPRLRQLEPFIQEHLSVRRLSRRLGRDVITVGKLLLPYLHQGYLQLSPLPHNSQSRPLLALAWRRSPRVVCVDDAATVRQVVESTLQEAGYEATAIAHPLTALSLIFQLNPDLIFCDIAMPELDGYELCTLLRHTPRFRYTPIIMLTSFVGLPDRLRAKIAGATDYLSKPFTTNELLTITQRYIGGASPLRDVADETLTDVLEQKAVLESSP
ncbi:response regulator [Synechococcus sp. PCC 6716]|nr:response regulator [Synechococcus sp. PCC 6716]